MDIGEQLWESFWKWNLVDVDLFCMCKCSGKSIHHLLLHYSIMRYLVTCVFVSWYILGDAEECDSNACMLVRKI